MSANPARLVRPVFRSENGWVGDERGAGTSLTCSEYALAAGACSFRARPRRRAAEMHASAGQSVSVCAAPATLGPALVVLLWRFDERRRLSRGPGLGRVRTLARGAPRNEGSSGHLGRLPAGMLEPPSPGPLARPRDARRPRRAV
jgi:hypothetical protein